MPKQRTIIPREQAKPPFFAGVDLGGTNIKVGLVDDQGGILAYERFRTESPKGPEDACRRMGECVRRLMATARLKAEEVAHVGLGSPGMMDIPAGMLLRPPNLPGWEDFPIRDRLSANCGYPVTFANDAGAAGYGEYWQGSGRGTHIMILLTLGTGIGGGIVIDGRSLDGVHSHGAECGHIIIDYRDDARMCSCGFTGHLEAYAGGHSVIKRTQEILATGRTSSLTARIAAGEALTPHMINDEGEKGDALSLEIVLETARYIGIGAASLMHTLDPSMVILGGAMNFGGHETELGRRFLARVQEEIRRRAFPVPAAQTKIDFAQLGGDAGFIGAAGLARLEYKHKTSA